MLDMTTKMALSRIVTGMYECAIGLESTLIEAESDDSLLDCPSAIEMIHDTCDDFLSMVDEHIQSLDPSETFASLARITLSLKGAMQPTLV